MFAAVHRPLTSVYFHPRVIFLKNCSVCRSGKSQANLEFDYSKSLSRIDPKIRQKNSGSDQQRSKIFGR